MLKHLFILVLLFLLAACGPGARAGAPLIALETQLLELGDLPNGKIAERVVMVRNDGDAPLVVEAVTTSCGCTTATLEPMTLAPGESGVLNISFDSGAHGPELRGPLMREVVLASNDPATPEVMVALTANILPPVE